MNIAVSALTTGWVLMVALGGLGHIFAVDAFFLSYWESVLAAFLISLIFSILIPKQ